MLSAELPLLLPFVVTVLFKARSLDIPPPFVIESFFQPSGSHIVVVFPVWSTVKPTLPSANTSSKRFNVLPSTVIFEAEIPFAITALVFEAESLVISVIPVPGRLLVYLTAVFSSLL